MSEFKNLVHVDTEHFDGLGDADLGHPYYVAHSSELRFTTQGDKFEAFLSNLQECIQLCMDDGDSVAEFGVALDTQVQIVGLLLRPNAKTAKPGRP